MGEAHGPHLELPDIDNVQLVQQEQLLQHVAHFAAQGMRFITITCIDNGEQFEVYYHFDHDMKLNHLLLVIGKKEVLPSITPIYFCAFVAENEMKDLFGVRVDGLNVDYQGRMLVSDELPSPPMRKSSDSAVRRNGDGS
ncbi:MAG: NADH-quinone oxidoreductase subunit C [Armatimonadota bacterium]|nr:NADH-quinone oxidoreductase subunit C [bacterium]MDW8322164.1 NADH-quinone oxidoreductase subunit C [Armatimonadota bacterium]